jgi:hypothetical protein
MRGTLHLTPFSRSKNGVANSILCRGFLSGALVLYRGRPAHVFLLHPNCQSDAALVQALRRDGDLNELCGGTGVSHVVPSSFPQCPLSF